MLNRIIMKKIGTFVFFCRTTERLWQNSRALFPGLHEVDRLHCAMSFATRALKNAAWSLEKSASQFKKNLDLIKNTSYKAYFTKEYYLQQL